ncbi:LANO_0H16864g1_1 [Lachancea nothofagi CBS 11611]|uniref:LANO_0H16864g1_1 n=1 Tax=Lachancea nothofagi CBS 11611 TaxID=1266666 RepID=A0A1G4KMS7_9SACH|nr:LANO_0H16864g1_1 [Lachancea nothofagi CBS 11611]
MVSINSPRSKYCMQEDDKPIDPRSLEWDGPLDMDNPHNWPVWRKWFTTMTAAILCLVVTMGSSLYVTGVPEMVQRYGYSQTLALAGLTFYLLGLSTVIGAPLSEVFGRKPIYLISLPMSMLFTMGVALSGGKMRVVLPVRFFSGVFASPALSVASGTIVDIWDMDEISIAMSLFCLAPFLGPVISPVIAGFATQAQGWRWATYIQLFAGGIIMPFIVFMPETHKTIILRNRAKKRKLNLIQPSAQDQKDFLKLTMTITVFRPFKMLMIEPTVLVFSIYVAFIFAVLFAFFEAYPVIFRGVYHMGYGVSGLAFIGIGIGLWIGSLFYIFYDRRYFFPEAPEGTQPMSSATCRRTRPFRGHRDPITNELLPLKPEKLLDICKIGSVALPISLFWLGWTSKASIHWMAPMAAGVPFGFGLILIFFSVIMYFSSCYPPLYVASALAANNLLRYVTSCIFPLFTIQMYEKMTIGWASSLFGFVCLAMIPLPWIFERYGEDMRKRSTFGFNAMQQEDQDEKSNKSMSVHKISTHRDSQIDLDTDKKSMEPGTADDAEYHSIRSHGIPSTASNISQPVLKGSFV